jgi:stalled ribosome rescue protein Dom34
MKVNNKEFKKILFRTAFCSMACDGTIDDLEINEMKNIDKNTSYFNEIDLSKELDHLIKKINTDGKKVISELFETLRKVNLNIVQELLILEVAMRIISADDRHEKNEIKFLKLLRSKLDINTEIILDRFGNIPYLNNMNYKKLNANREEHLSFINSVNLPELTQIKDIKLK